MDSFFERVTPHVRKGFISVYLANARKPNISLDVQPLTLEEKIILYDGLHRSYGSTNDEIVLAKMQEEQEYITNTLPTLPSLASTSPPPTVECRFREFDNIKLFYHLDNPSLYPQGTYTFYIGRPNCQPHECIDWYNEGIRVDARGFDGKWGGCRLLKVPGGTQVRIKYTHQGRNCTKLLAFPYPSPEELAVVFTQYSNGSSVDVLML